MVVEGPSPLLATVCWCCFVVRLFLEGAVLDQAGKRNWGVVVYRAEWVTGDEVLGAADGFSVRLKRGQRLDGVKKKGTARGRGGSAKG